ncbi:neuronal pentraxin-1-like [Thalassophryne amazonica]|uniref:neuronal pentraxin-1-like n=1 Tax=Thalassophryne amazonica TaxID=390379 RepID=UPI0014708A23|nr:neuronal pentraxin-1-like [Thalassophryne amazonica]
MTRDSSPLNLAALRQVGGASLEFIFPLRSLIFSYFLSCAAGTLPGMEYDYGISPKFVCTPIPPEADPNCYSPPSVPHGPSSNGHSNSHNNGHNGSSRQGLMSDEAKATILHLRESLVRQKETILDQRETIRELTAKLTLCEGFGGHHSIGHHVNHHDNHHNVHHVDDHDGHHDNHHVSHHDDHNEYHDNHHSSSSSHHGPSSYHHYSHSSHRSAPHHRKGGSYGKHSSFSPEQTGKTLQTLKERLENLEARNSSSSYSSSLKELLQRKITALEEQLHSYYQDHHNHGHRNENHDDHHEEHHSSTTHHNNHHDDTHEDHHDSSTHHDDHHNDHHDDHHDNSHQDEHHNNNHNSHRYNHQSSNHNRHHDPHHNYHHGQHRSHYSNHHNGHHGGHQDDHHSREHHSNHHKANHHDDHHGVHHSNHHANDHHGNHHGNDHHLLQPPLTSKETSARGPGHSKLETVLSQLHHGNTEHGHKKKPKHPGAFLLDFPMRTNYMYARMKRSVVSEIFALTICVWLKAGAGPGLGTPFSYAVPGQANELVLIEWGSNPMELLIDDKAVTLPITLTDGKWHHMCVTWATRDGLWEVYQDGMKKGSGQNLSAWHPVKPGGTFIMGQEQDTIEGRFDVTQSFMGEMSDLQFWSRVLTSAEIYSQATCGGHLIGDVMSWSEESVELHGGLAEYPFDPCH